MTLAALNSASAPLKQRYSDGHIIPQAVLAQHLYGNAAIITQGIST